MVKKISIVIPAYNESENILLLHSELKKILSNNKYEYEVIFVDDGSTDDTVKLVKRLVGDDSRIKLIVFSRNFGKELATSAGINSSVGDAIICLDADGQHPVELIPDFIKEWEHGSDVVVGIRKKNSKEGIIKKFGSYSFYKLFNALTKNELVPGSTDYRLIDKSVQEVFSELSESNRITRGLIDWIGFRRSYIEFIAKPRLRGTASYDTRKLIKLALDSFVSLSFTPLYIFGYLGLFIMVLSTILGAFIVVENYVLADPMNLNVTGSASLGVLVLFLVGLILVSQWITSLYISRMYDETKRRPVYIIDKKRSSM